MKKILFITTRLIYPINDGRKVVLYNYCKGLAKELNCEVRIFALIDRNEANNTQPNFISKVYKGDLPSKWEKIKNLLINTILLNKWPLQVSIYYSDKTKKYLNKIIEEYEPNIVICDMARTAEYLKDLDGNKYNKILDMDDLLSKRYLRQVNSNYISSNSIGAYFEKLPKIIQMITNNKYLVKKILLKETSLLKKYEISISNYYRKIIFVSPIEAGEFNKTLNQDKCVDITIGVDYDYFSLNTINKKKNNYIVYIGNMNVAHNKDSIISFLNNIFPKIINELPNCILRIVGVCSEDFKKILSGFTNVEVTGEVDDIRQYVQDCTVSIAPFVYGTGIKTKVLESMAMGKPVVTNSIGVEGIDAIRYQDIIVEDSYDNFAKEVIKLLRDDEYNKKISKNGQEFVRKNHIWNNIILKFDSIITINNN